MGTRAELPRIGKRSIDARKARRIGPRCARREELVKNISEEERVGFRRKGNRTILPLLLPERDGLPFALGLEICGCHEDDWTKDKAEGSWTLQYVLEGCAELRAGEGEEAVFHLGAGDGLIVPPDIPMVLSPSTSKTPDRRDGSEWEYASLVAYIPECLVDPNVSHQDRTQEAMDVAQSQVLQTWDIGKSFGKLNLQQVEDILVNATRRHGNELDSELVCPRPARETSDKSQGGLISLRKLKDTETFQLPNQTNRLALMFDPSQNKQMNATFGIEVFEPGHITPLHVHTDGYELFFVLSGRGVGHCEGRSFDLEPGSLAVFPPKTSHGIDNINVERLYCLELMLPNDMFAELIRSGKQVGVLDDDDLCTLINFGCG